MQLLKHSHPGQTLVWHQGRPISRAAFSHAARQLAAALPAASHVINLCNGRLSFMLSFAAAALRGQTTLLPPNQTAATLAKLQHDFPQHYIADDQCLKLLTDHDHHALDIDAHYDVMNLFTSGSTGAPQLHAKSWATLARTGELDAARFAGSAAINLVATVPSQHMFGLQTTLLLPFMSHCAIHDSQPFYPADIRAALGLVPGPRALITTPTHLRACLASNLDLPELQFILCATAPLATPLAQQAETRWGTQVLEIYGSTEAGTMATRRSAATETWQLLPGASLQQTAGSTLFHAPHLPKPLLLNDQIELLANDTFRLLGRAEDQLKIAGKRASLGELNHLLLQIPGVTDGVIFMPARAQRTAALVVSTMTAAEILDALAHSIDAAFLPRPLIMMAQLPRNPVGKLTQSALQAALVNAKKPVS